MKRRENKLVVGITSEALGQCGGRISQWEENNFTAAIQTMFGQNALLVVVQTGRPAAHTSPVQTVCRDIKLAGYMTEEGELLMLAQSHSERHALGHLMNRFGTTKDKAIRFGLALQAPKGDVIIIDRAPNGQVDKSFADGLSARLHDREALGIVSKRQPLPRQGGRMLTVETSKAKSGYEVMQIAATVMQQYRFPWEVTLEQLEATKAVLAKRDTVYW